MIPRQLLLIRHAQAGWATSSQGDFERPLTPAGRDAATALGEWLAKAGITVDAIVTSPAPRAVMTATLVAAAWPHPPPLYREPRVYEASVATLKQLISRLDDAWQCVALVGHNPALSQFADCLLGEPTVIEFPPGGLAWLEWPAAAHWVDLPSGGAVLRGLREPAERVHPG